MKTLNKILLVIILTTNISLAQKYKLELPEITNSFEKFNLDTLPNSSDKYIGYTKKNKKGKTIYVNIGKNEYVENDSLHFCLIRYTKSDDSKSTFSGYDFSINPIVGIYKEFHENGNIKLKGIYCFLGFKIGNWYKYDENGELINVENFDRDYKFGYKKVFSFCLINKISLQRINNDKSVSQIRKYNKCWYIQSQPDYNKRVYKEYEIDGNTGKLISTKELPLEVYSE
ncbi:MULTISPECIES: hypothetical protein [Flavobacterium]|uniref:hypothetical protein n=1 Tax=Flavobacterium TaxID=237 RepID=UPI00188AFC66|nr:MULTISPECIES: hypothetical protein [Flavobacterium]MBF4472725.1 hypothetical protein [Flavobacterium sp. HJJ]